MHRYLSASWVFPVTSSPLKNGVLSVSPAGEILAVYSEEDALQKQLQPIERFEGVLVPGFINAHCHLELSHLYGKIDEGTGLTAFVKQIIAKRAAPANEVQNAMLAADEQMYNNGIVAVGDIANQQDSKQTKLQSKIYYHTFVEVFGFDKPSAPIMATGLANRAAFAPLNASIVPHAPYSVSAELFAEIAAVTRAEDVLTIHNQETLAETLFFKEGVGSFAEMYEAFGFKKASYHGNGQSSLQYHLKRFPQNNLLLVHNTLTMQEDVAYAAEQHAFVYWCLCPNANLYIENALPNVAMLQANGAKIVLGTDSLASNHQLSILAEMQTLQQHKAVAFDDLLTWATINGAKALNIANKYGSFQPGKFPGVNLVNLGADLKIDNQTKVTPLA